MYVPLAPELLRTAFHLSLPLILVGSRIAFHVPSTPPNPRPDHTTAGSTSGGEERPRSARAHLIMDILLGSPSSPPESDFGHRDNGLDALTSHVRGTCSCLNVVHEPSVAHHGSALQIRLVFLEREILELLARSEAGERVELGRVVGRCSSEERLCRKRVWRRRRRRGGRGGGGRGGELGRRRLQERRRVVRLRGRHLG